MKYLGSVFALALLATNAQAAVFNTSFTASDYSINAGDSVTVNLDLSLNPGRKYDDAEFVGGRVTISSSDGENPTFRIPRGDDSVSFSTIFTFDHPGDYNPYFVGTVKYRQEYTKRELVGYDFERLPGWSLDYWLAICNPVYENVTYFKNFKKHFEGELHLTVKDNTPPNPVPVPGGPAPFASALALAYFGYRKLRSKNVQPV